MLHEHLSASSFWNGAAEEETQSVAESDKSKKEKFFDRYLEIENARGPVQNAIDAIVTKIDDAVAKAIDTIKAIALAQLGARLGTPPHEASPRLFQRLALALWRGNSAMWARRAPIHQSWEDRVE